MISLCATWQVVDHPVFWLLNYLVRQMALSDGASTEVMEGLISTFSIVPCMALSVKSQRGDLLWDDNHDAGWEGADTVSGVGYHQG
jgi:hypothetical protein